LYKFPDKEHDDLRFPPEVSSFGLPMGAVIESWPVGSTENNNNNSFKNLYLTDLEPVFNTFVLNVNSSDGVVMDKVYGSCVIFYESFDETKLNPQQLQALGCPHGASAMSRTLHSNKCLIILSRHPLFETYKSFLLFLFNKYAKSNSATNEQTNIDMIMPIERFARLKFFKTKNKIKNGEG
jgi:hypothetical protein